MMYNKVNNVRETHGKKEEAIPMARKWLSGVLAFTMVFGCTAPMALAEEAPVENVENVEDVEQYANYVPSIDTVSLGAGKNTTVKVAGLPEGATLEGASNGKLTVGNLDLEFDSVARTLKITAQSGFAADESHTLQFKNINSEGVEDFIAPVKLTVKFVDATVAYDKVVFNDESDIELTLGTAKEIKVHVLDVETGKTAKITDLEVKQTTASKEFFTVSVKDDVDDKGNTVGQVIVITPVKKTSGLEGNDKVIKVSGRLAAGAVLTNGEYTIKAVNDSEDKDIFQLVLKTTADKVAVNEETKLIPQAYYMDEYGDIVQEDKPTDLVWYVDSQKMDFSKGDFKVENIITGNTVTFSLDKNNGIVTMNSNYAGTFNITVTDAAGKMSSGATITVESGSVILAGDTIGFVDADKNPDMSDMVLAGGTVDLGAKNLVVYHDNGEYKGTVAQYDGTVTYAINDAKAKLVSSVDKNGVVTIKNDANMDKLLENGDFPINVAVKAKFPADKVNAGDPLEYNTVFKVVVTKAATDAEKLEVKAGEDVLEDYGNMVLTAGTPVTLTWKVMDKNDFTEGLNQKMIWTVKNVNPFTDNNVYATIDSATGVVTPLMESAGKAYLEGVSVANPNLGIRVALYITAADVKPTAEPTAEPSVEPTTEPTAEPTTAPVQKGKVATSSSSLNVRETPDGEKIGSLKKGTIVTILGKDGDWLLVTDGDLTGYVAARYIEIIEDKPVDPETGVATVKTAGSALNMRQSPSTSAKVITKIANGSTVTVVEKGEKWTKVKYNGKTGYVSTQYLEFEEDAVG